MMRFVKKGDIIALGCDHGGYELGNTIEAHLQETGVQVLRFGCLDGAAIDYPPVAEETCRQVIEGKAVCAILVCGTGIGMSMAANKVKEIRAAACSETFSAKYTRLHNDANTLCLGGRVIGPGLALEIVDLFVNTGFEGGRHQRRVDAIMAIEK